MLDVAHLQQCIEQEDHQVRQLYQSTLLKFVVFSLDIRQAYNMNTYHIFEGRGLLAFTT